MVYFASELIRCLNERNVCFVECLVFLSFLVERECTKAFSINLKVQNFDKFLPPVDIERMRASGELFN